MRRPAEAEPIGVFGPIALLLGRRGRRGARPCRSDAIVRGLQAAIRAEDYCFRQATPSPRRRARVGAAASHATDHATHIFLLDPWVTRTPPSRSARGRARRGAKGRYEVDGGAKNGRNVTLQKRREKKG